MATAVCVIFGGRNMQKHHWWENSVVYQIYPRSFQDSNGDGIGDLNGISKRLPYIKALGVDLIWICPVYKSPNDDNGYDISNYQEIQPEYGTMEDFDALLNKAHNMGLKVIMDLVVNHTSDEHPWFLESRSSKDNPKRDWYIWRDGKNGREPNNWESIFGGSAWEFDEPTGQYYLHLFSRKMPDLNWQNAKAREAIFEMIQWWVRKGIDGFRVDAISHIQKPDLTDMPNPEGKRYVSSFDKHMNQPGILDLLQKMKTEAFSCGDLFTVAEANGVKSSQACEWTGKDRGIFSTMFQFEHINLWNMDSIKHFSLPDFKRALTRWQDATCAEGNVALALENHDLTRCVSHFGNSEKYWKESAKCLAMMYMLQKGTPFIYQGQELGMTNADYTCVEQFQDEPSLCSYHKRIAAGMPEHDSFTILSETVRDNCRTPMQWDETENAGFTTGKPWMDINHNSVKINALQQMQDSDSIWHFYQKLIKIRKQNHVLIDGKYDLLLPEDKQIYAYTRTLGNECCRIVCNVSSEPAGLPAELLDGKCILCNYADVDTKELRPYECRLYYMER
jgi:alpha-glucosidase